METIVRALIFGLLMALIMGWLARSRFTQKLGEGEVRYPASVAIVIVVVGVFMTFCTVMSYGARTGGLVVASVFAAFALLSLFVLIELAITRYRVRKDGFDYAAPLSSKGTARWGEVERVAWSATMQWFTVGLANGRRLRVSPMMAGLPALASAMLAGVPKARFEKDAARLFGDIVAGRPTRPF